MTEKLQSAIDGLVVKTGWQTIDGKKYYYKEDGTQTGTADIYLADFRDGKSYICAAWTKVDLSALGTFNKVAFTISSSDVGDYGMNTPAYFCIDDVTFNLVSATSTAK